MLEPGLSRLLEQLDPQAGLAQRHLWLISLCQWIRGNGPAHANPASSANSRLQLLLDAVEARPELHARLQAWWRVLLQTLDVSTLLADFGFAPRSAFLSELTERLRRKLLPQSPETLDASALFSLALPQARDAQWLLAIDSIQLERLERLLGQVPACTIDDSCPSDAGDACASGRTHASSAWQHLLLDAITYCAGQTLSTGFAPELRLRMSPAARAARPFHALIRDVEALRAEVLRRPSEAGALEAAAQQLRERLEACRQAVATVYAHLEENGISVGLVFRLRQLRERVLRIRELLECLLSRQPSGSAVRLLARLVQVGQERNSIRALIAANSSLLAAKVAERSAETGAHYITRDVPEYSSMLRKAAGGGALTGITTMLKYGILTLGLSAFWGGFWAGAMYAASFVLIQLLHCTLATKQPAMTAPAMAAKLKDISSPEAVSSFVDEVANLVRSQVAAVLGNVLVVFPVVLLLSGGFTLFSGHAMIGLREAEYTLHSLSLLGPTVLFAAFTGCLLFASSIIAGWAENWFVLHQLDSAMRYNPRITALLGTARAGRWAHFMRSHVSGFASNISLGFMLGLIPAFMAFFGLGLEVRHVTLSTGQLAAACAAYGLDVLRMPALWWALAAIPAVGALNLVVSFYLAYQLALRAHNVSGVQRAHIHAAIWARWWRKPLSFLIPV